MNDLGTLRTPCVPHVGTRTLSLLLPILLVGLGGSPGADEEDGLESEVSHPREEAQNPNERVDETGKAPRAQDQGAEGQGETGDALSVGEFLQDLDMEDNTGLFGSVETLISIHGFADFEYENAEGAGSAFDLNHANLFLAADLGDIAQAWVEVEFEHGGDTIELDQAEIRLLFEETTVGFGRFYAPVGIERRTWYPPSNNVISRPDVFQRVVPGNWYEAGVRVEHRRTVQSVDVEIELAISNGLGEEADTDIRAARQVHDDNNDKALSGRLGVMPVEHLGCGISFATMEYAANDSIGFLGADVEFSPPGWLFRAEVIESSVEDSDGPAGDFDRWGWYALASREVMRGEKRSLWINGRVDVLDGNDQVTDGEDFTAYTLGAAWWYSSNLSFRVEVREFDGRHGARLAGGTSVAASIVLDF